MLQHLQIKNFKGWKDTGLIEMAPITLFFGVNSSGKSSIGQFLMMLKQTVESPDRRTVFFPGGKTSLVQLGSYREMVYGRKSNSSIYFWYGWDIQPPLQIKDSLSTDSFEGKYLSFEAEVGMGGGNKNSLVSKFFTYELFKDADHEESELAIHMNRRSLPKSEYSVKSNDYKLRRYQGRAWSPGSPVCFYGFPDEVVAYYQNADFVKELNLIHENLFKSLHYLGPLRTKTERLYSWAGNEPEDVGPSGENTISALLAARNRKISYGYKKRAKPFEHVIAEQLLNMGLIDDFRVDQISQHRQEYEVNVRTVGSKSWVDLPDVGFGISQVLPVLVQCFYARPNSIIIMEQPEIHLHPRAQAALADVLIDVVKSREDGDDRNIQLIVETHSEHFLRRLQRRIAEGIISDEMVSAYFARIGRAPATLEALQIDEYGNIQNWPEKFFGDEMEDISAQAMAAMQKKMKKSGEANDE